MRFGRVEGLYCCYYFTFFEFGAGVEGVELARAASGSRVGSQQDHLHRPSRDRRAAARDRIGAELDVAVRVAALGVPVHIVQVATPHAAAAMALAPPGGGPTRGTVIELLADGDDDGDVDGR